jgi:VIT1/CCC1 family predicted Fe2+/Mn2+ transporter
MEKTEKADNGIPISLGTAILSIVLVCGTCLGIGLGAGFYFGIRGTSYHYSHSELSSVSETCSAAIKAYDGQIREMESNRGILEARVAKYETFLVGTMDNVEEANRLLGVGGL